jgi:hypothetical protein
MGAPLNVFRTITANVTTTANTIYTAPTGYTTVVLLAQVSNTGANTITVTSNHLRGGIPTALVANAYVPTNDAINLLTGKLVLNTSDGINISANVNSSSQMLLSILETANP